MNTPPSPSHLYHLSPRLPHVLEGGYCLYGWARTHARTHVHTHTRKQAVADETFADERSKEMFENDTREKLIKELLKQEIRNVFFYTNTHMNAYVQMRMYEHTHRHMPS